MPFFVETFARDMRIYIDQVIKMFLRFFLFDDLIKENGDTTLGST